MSDLRLGWIIVGQGIVDSGDDYPTELNAENKSNQPLLLLDSEEVTRGHNSFSFNSSVLLKDNSTTKVPAALTGRYDENSGDNEPSTKFLDSGTMMPPTLRTEKMIMVSDSLAKHKQIHANDGILHAVILQLASRLGLIPGESEEWNDSMMQIYESQAAQLDKYESVFQLTPRQKGLLAIINNKVIGFDLFSSELAYQFHASRMLRSYALEALLPSDEEQIDLDAAGCAQEFLLEAKRLNQSIYDSIGLGSDIRVRLQTIRTSVVES